MALSSNCLFHFTEHKEALLGILRDNFKLGWCRESYDYGNEHSDFFVPMVSFCDIPLSQIKQHIGSYGPYGLGLTRTWGIKNGLNPVIYTQEESMLNASLRKGLSYVLNEQSTGDEKATSAAYALANILGFVKPYRGDLTRKGKTETDYRFSDEREWRYVPTTSYEKLYIAGVEKGDGKEILKDHELNDEVEAHRIEFEPNDIKYIIIQDDSEIREFMRHLDDVKGGKYSGHDMERLRARFLTVEQIIQDI